MNLFGDSFTYFFHGYGTRIKRTLSTSKGVDTDCYVTRQTISCIQDHLDDEINEMIIMIMPDELGEYNQKVSLHLSDESFLKFMHLCDINRKRPFPFSFLIKDLSDHEMIIYRKKKMT